MEQRETYTAGNVPPMSPVMLAGIAAEIRGLVNELTVDNYQDQLTEVIRVAQWARGPVETFDTVDDMLADLMEEEDDDNGRDV